MLSTPDISSVRFTHAGFWVEDLDKMADFYQRVFKMHRSDHGKIDAHGLRAELAFLTGDPEEHHQLVFLAGKPKVCLLTLSIKFHSELGNCPICALIGIFCRQSRTRARYTRLAMEMHGACIFTILRATDARYIWTPPGTLNNLSGPNWT